MNTTIYITKTLVTNKNLRKVFIYTGVITAILLICLAYFIKHPIDAIIDISKIKPVTPTQTEKQFIDKIAEPSKEAYKEGGTYPSITIAQAMVESGTGTSELTQKADNLFGIKAFDWTGPTITMPTQEEHNGIYTTIMATFRVYSSWDDSIKDHTKFLEENSTYRENGVFSAKNFEDQAIALQKAGYATDEKYAAKLVTKIIQYNLDKYD